MYLAAADAVAQGHQVRVGTSANRYWLDVNGHMVQIRSGGSGPGTSATGTSAHEKTDFVIFTDFDAQDDRPAYYIAPADWFRQDV